MKKITWFLLLTLIVIASCKKEDNQAEIDEMLIKEYLANNNIAHALRHETGVYYSIDSIGDGSGVFPNVGSVVRVYYRGYLLNGTVFDPGNYGDTPVNFNLWQTIGGWQIGMPFFERGSKGRLYIPSGYGYGTRNDLSNIPPNSVLIFDVELLNVF